MLPVGSFYQEIKSDQGIICRLKQRACRRFKKVSRSLQWKRRGVHFNLGLPVPTFDLILLPILHPEMYENIMDCQTK
jgi:hypothetical protein